MTTQEIKLVRNSWANVLLNREEAGNIFYKTLFGLSPEIRDLFKSDLKTQNQKLMSSITLIVTKLNKLDNLQQEVHFLAKRHLNYQVKPAYFYAFGEAFITMLATTFKKFNEWTPAMESAWMKVYQLISQAMIEELD
ncbi:MAG TPA: hypothetical protein DCS93_05870 [Microscillaceae bacterium]|nr:hypothetical protein [Microscillaceae bacterium]